MTQFAAIILAAGLSRRFSGENKLFAPLAGKPVIAHVLGCVAGLPLSQRLLVTSGDGMAIRNIAGADRFDILTNDQPERGLGSSIAIGAAALDDQITAAFVVLGDMPLAPQSVYHSLMRSFEKHKEKSVFAPCYQGRQGNPVLFGRKHFPLLQHLSGDRGARAWIEANRQLVQSVPVDTPAICFDIDTPRALEQAEALISSGEPSSFQ